MKLHFSFQTLYQLTSGVLDHGFPRSVQEIGLPGELQAEGRNLLRSLLISHRQLLHTRRHHTSECTSSMPEFICSMVISTLHSFILHSTLFFFSFFSEQPWQACQAIMMRTSKNPKTTLLIYRTAEVFWTQEPIILGTGEGDKAGGNYFCDDRHQVENMNY